MTSIPMLLAFVASLRLRPCTTGLYPMHEKAPRVSGRGFDLNQCSSSQGWLRGWLPGWLELFDLVQRQLDWRLPSEDVDQ